MKEIWPCPRPLLLLQFNLFLFTAGYYLIDISIQQYVVKIACLSDDELNATMCERHDYNKTVEDKLQADAGLYLIIYRLLVNGPSVVLVLFYGSWSDRNGRKWPMILPCVGSLLGIILYYASAEMTDFRINMLLIGAFLQGVVGNDSVARMAKTSYVVDMTSVETRSAKLAIVIGIKFFGQMSGIVLSGLIFQFGDIKIILYVGFAILLLSSVLVVSFLPESIPLSKEETGYLRIDDNPATKSSESSSNGKNLSALSEILNHIKDSLRILIEPVNNNRHVRISILIAMICINQTCKNAEPDVVVLFIKRRPFLWDETQFSLLMSLEAISQALINMIVIPSVLSAYNISDIVLVFVAAVCFTGRCIWAGFMDQAWMVYTTIIIGGITGFINVSNRSLLSKTVSTQECGKTFSLVAIAETLSKLSAAAVFVSIYRATVSFFPGFAFLTEALAYFMLAILACVLWKLSRKVNCEDGNEESINLDRMENYGTGDATDTVHHEKNKLNEQCN